MDDIKKAVRDRYAGYATKPRTGGGCGCSSGSCCSSSPSLSEQIGYSPADLANAPATADLGLGCGNPTALASLQAGETVLDLGSGGGIDCFIAARRVGPTGAVIGVDMTAEMVELARRNARDAGYGNVEFRLGEIEALPVADASVNVILSNCVINLVPDKPRAFREAFRVLSPGGRMEVSDVVTLGEIPEAIRHSVEAYGACLGGASLLEEYLAAISAAGFVDVRVVEQKPYAGEDDSMLEGFVADIGLKDVSLEEARAAARLFASVHVCARKPD